MIFFIYAIFIFFLVFSIVSIYMLYQKISQDHFYKLTLRSFLKKQYKTGSERYFSSYTILQTIKLLRKKRKKDALINLAYARIDKALSFLSEIKREDLRISLSAHFDFEEGLIEFEHLIMQMPNNMFVFGEIAELYYLTNQYSRLKMVLDKIDEKKSIKYTIAKKLYFHALMDMRDGDLLPASIDGNKVIKIFNQNKAYVEEAKTYMLLGIMYKACAIFDPSQFMFETALKISSQLNNKIGIIEAYGNLAMLMSAQERFDETEAYLEKAIKISDNSKTDAYILNQKGLTYLLKKDINKALDILEIAKNINQQSKNQSGLALNNEIISYVKYEQKSYNEAIKHASDAENLYKKLTNTSALMEVKYVQALSYFELSNLKEAEKIAREIIEISKKEQTSFHIANTYNLLGLIFLNKGDLSRAKALFKESLRNEQRNDRFNGIATDYYNIGLIESKEGLSEQAMISFENALEFASMQGENSLKEIIKKKIKNLS